MSPVISSPVAGSSGIWPDRNTVPPMRTAWEYGPMAAGACSVWMGVRDMGIPSWEASPHCRSGMHAVPCHGRSDALDAQHHAEFAHLADHRRQVPAIANLDTEAQHRHVGVAFEVFDLVDVGLGLGDRRRH